MTTAATTTTTTTTSTTAARTSWVSRLRGAFRPSDEVAQERRRAARELAAYPVSRSATAPQLPTRLVHWG